MEQIKNKTAKQKNVIKQKRKVRQKRQKQRSNAIAKLANLQVTETPLNYVEPNRINSFRNKSGGELLKELRIYRQYVKNRYLVGLVHPDLAVKEQIPVKLYSDVPIPTASIGHHEQYQFATSSVGTFMLTWRPNFLMTSLDLSGISATDYSHLTYNNSSALVGNTVIGNNTFVPGSYVPSIAIQRYRLVSAMIKISYNGSVLNQAGTMISCACFEPFSACTGNGSTGVVNFNDSLADRYTKFTTITNGLWNCSTNITNDAQGLECLYVPTDPNDYIFTRAGRFFDAIPSTAGLVAGPADGAHIAYVVAGRNLPASSNCVIVDVYYNYEVIADPTSAPFLRSAPDSVFDSKDRDMLADTISGVVKQGSLIKPISTGSSFTDILLDVAKLGVGYLPKILASLM